jgi:hypothetical protein
MSATDQFEPLEQFLGGYFHQDWAVDYDSEDAVIAAFRDDVGPEGVAEVIASIDALLATPDSDEALKTRLLGMGLASTPSGADGTARGWLREVRAELSA